MSIKGLSIYSNVSNNHWILKNYNNDTQDKYSYENYKNLLPKLNKENYFNYYWNSNDSTNFKPDSRKKCVKGNLTELLDENSLHIARILTNFMKNWNLSISLNRESYEFTKLNKSVLTLIRDSLFLNVHNILNNSNLKGVQGFIISYSKDFNLYEYFLKFCKKAFWLSEKINEENSKIKPNYIYTINFSDNSGTYGTNLCYFNRCYSATCCCERCSRVLYYLERNHKDLFSSENLKKLLINESSCLMEFLNHNKKYQTLEYKLLKISINGLLLKKNIEKYLDSLTNGNDSSSSLSLDKLLSSSSSMIFSSCFVLIKNLELLYYQISLKVKNPLNLGSLITDLLIEYTDLWDELSLPIFTFLFYKQEETSQTNELLINDSKFLYNSSYLSLLSDSRYFKFSTFISDDIINENSKLEYFRDMLKDYSSDKDKNDDGGNTNTDNNKDTVDITVNVNNDGSKKEEESNNNKDTELLRSLMRLTRGYSLDEVKVLTRLAKCESLKDNVTSKDFHKVVVKYFEKAVSLRPLVDFSSSFGLYPELSSFSSFLNISPLKYIGGNIVSKTGLESLVLSPETLEQVNNILTQKVCKDITNIWNYSLGVVIKGDSGVGKTSLAHCMAQEMGSVFFSINILNFLMPQVGLSEKMLHSFLSTIRNHFSGSKTGVRKDLVKCVILLEGLESLKGKEGYMKRLIFCLSKELDEFSSRCRFLLDSSVLFITTCQSYSDIPSRLLKAFNEKLEILNLKMDENMARKYFELFLNMRCNFINDLDKLIEHIKKRNYLDFLTPLKIATISKDASLHTVNEISYSSKDSMGSGSDIYLDRLVTLETVISVMDSTFK